jgi:hypothetical protein
MSVSLNKLTQFPVFNVLLSLDAYFYASRLFFFHIISVRSTSLALLDGNVVQTHLFPCVFLLPPLESFLLVDVVARSFVVSSGTGKLVAYPCSCSGIKQKEEIQNYHGMP